MVEEHLRGRFLFVSANVVNHPWLSHVHHRMGATLAFHPPLQNQLEEFTPPSALQDWELRPQPNGLEDTAIGQTPCVPLAKQHASCHLSDGHLASDDN